MYKKILLTTFSVLFVGFLPSATVVNAEATVGGQVNTEGKITFYEKVESSTVESSSMSSEFHPPKKTTTESQKPPATSAVSKPTGGSLPSTGDRVKKYGSIGGICLLLAFLILLYRKQKKEGQS